MRELTIHDYVIPIKTKTPPKLYSKEEEVRIKKRFDRLFRRITKVYNSDTTTHEPLWITPVRGNRRYKVIMNYYPKPKRFTIRYGSTMVGVEGSEPITIMRRSRQHSKTFLTRLVRLHLTLINKHYWPESVQYIETLVPD